MGSRGATEEPHREMALVSVVVGVVVALLGVFGVAGAVLDEPFRVFTKEPVEQFEGAAAYVGILAHLTWLIWATGAVAALFAAASLTRLTPDNRRTGFLVAAALLTVALLMDDFVMIHDRVLPRIGVPEEALYLGYGAALALLLWRFRPELAGGGLFLALGAGAFLTVSIGSDFLQEHVGIYSHAVEDGSKMIGAALWATFLVRSGFYAILDATSTIDGGAVDRRPLTAVVGAEEPKPL